MLLFVDLPKAFRVFRIEEGEAGARRVRLGAVQKNKMEIKEELRQALSSQELAEVEQVIKRYSDIEANQTRLDVYRFPSIVRGVVDFVNSAEANDLEKRILTSALVDGLRLIRKAGRHEEDPVG